MLMTIWTTISCSKIRISSFSWFVEYGWPSRLIFASWYLRLSILEKPRNANVKEEMMAAVLDNMNSFILWMEGDTAVATPTEPHPQNMIPHQIPWPNSYFSDPTIHPVLQINDMYKWYEDYIKRNGIRIWNFYEPLAKIINWVNMVPKETKRRTI